MMYVYGPLPLMTTLPMEKDIAHARNSDEAFRSEVGQLQAGRVRGTQGRNDDVRVRTTAAHDDVAHGEGHRPREELRRGILRELVGRHVVMRLEKLGRELVAFELSKY